MTNLKRIIDEKGVQQRRLAEQVGVTEVSMSRYVRGERIPKAPIAIRIADTLGVDVKELYGWDDAHVIGGDEDMTTEEVADVLRNTAWLGTDANREQIEEAVEMAIKALPSAQIIRCKECKHYIQNIHCVGGHYNGCEEWEHDGCEYPVEENWFCIFAERRTDEAD